MYVTVVHYGCGHNLQLLVQLLTDRPVQRLVATQCQGGWACMCVMSGARSGVSAAD